MKKIFENISASSDRGRLVRFVEHNGRKFRIYVELSNGDPLGFNHKCCFSVMTTDGDFKQVEDNRALGIRCPNDYHAAPTYKEEIMKRVVLEFESFIKKLY